MSECDREASIMRAVYSNDIGHGDVMYTFVQGLFKLRRCEHASKI